MGLQSRSALITWDPPAQTNGIITNYTLYLYSGSITSSDHDPDAVPSTRSTYTSNLSSKPSVLPNFDGIRQHSNFNFLTLSDPSRPKGSSLNSTSSADYDNKLSTTKKYIHSVIFSTSRPGTVENNQMNSSSESTESRGHNIVLFKPTEPKTSSVETNLSLSAPNSTLSIFNPDHFITQDPFTFSSFLANTSRPTPLSVTVPGNTTSYTFLNLHPYQRFSLQVLKGLL